MEFSEYQNREDNKVLAYVVKDENLLGYLYKNNNSGIFWLGILNVIDDPFPIIESDFPKIRKATLDDFKKFRICPDGYNLSL